MQKISQFSLEKSKMNLIMNNIVIIHLQTEKTEFAQDDTQLEIMIDMQDFQPINKQCKVEIALNMFKNKNIKM